MGCNMVDAQTQTQLTGNRIDTVLKELGRLRRVKYDKKYNQKERANKLIVDQIGKSMAKHIVRAVQKPVRQARKKARAPSASAFLHLMNSGDTVAFLLPPSSCNELLPRSE